MKLAEDKLTTTHGTRKRKLTCPGVTLDHRATVFSPWKQPRPHSSSVMKRSTRPASCIRLAVMNSSCNCCSAYFGLSFKWPTRLLLTCSRCPTLARSCCKVLTRSCVIIGFGEAYLCPGHSDVQAPAKQLIRIEVNLGKMLRAPISSKSVHDNVVEPELATPWSMAEHERGNAAALRSFLLPEHLRPAVKHDEYTHEEIPVIDMAPYLLGGEEAAMATVVAQVRDACLNWGFFYVVNHGIEEKLNARVLRQAEAFFRLPFSEKMKIVKEPGRYTGYGHATVKKDDIRPWAEGLFFANDGSVGEFSRKLFPSGTNNDFVDSYSEYNAKVQQLASTLMGIIVQSLEVDPTHFVKYTKNTGGYLRWNYYPACPVPEQTMGLNPHTDFNLVTVLFQSDVGGLQIEKDGRWVAVKPRPGALCVNIGDVIQVLTNKKYKSVPHRAVVNATKTRISLAYFYSPLPSIDIVPSPDLVDEDNPVKYEPFTFQTFTKMKQTYFLDTLKHFEVKNE